jgi:peptide-methionine (S)-S-oxide reductase
MKNKVGFGGGCHWCTEAVFQSLRGEIEVQQGWISSDKNEVSFSEAVVVYFDSNLISLQTQIEIHLMTHPSTSAHSMSGKYRSAIYYTDEGQQNEVNSILINFQQGHPTSPRSLL